MDPKHCSPWLVCDRSSDKKISKVPETEQVEQTPSSKSSTSVKTRRNLRRPSEFTVTFQHHENPADHLRDYINQVSKPRCRMQNPSAFPDHLEYDIDSILSDQTPEEISPKGGALTTANSETDQAVSVSSSRSHPIQCVCEPNSSCGWSPQPCSVYNMTGEVSSTLSSTNLPPPAQNSSSVKTQKFSTLRIPTPRSSRVKVSGERKPVVNSAVAGLVVRKLETEPRPEPAQWRRPGQ